MSITPPTSEPVIPYYASDIITDALIEIGAAAPGETPGNEEAQWAFRKYNYLLDMWAARKNFVPYSNFNTYTLTPNLSPHTIGPGPTATFQVKQRPVKIVRANLLLNNVTPNVSVSLTIRDAQWWMEDVSIQDLPSPEPTDLFYSPTFPDGSLYFWPVPTSAYGVQLETWALLNQLSDINDPVGGADGDTSIPPGYRNALMLSLAETLLPGASRQLHPTLAVTAAAARLAVFGNNSAVARMSTQDSGAPGANGGRNQTTFNYRSRSGG